MTTQEKYNKMSDSAKAREDWMNRKWRPYMAWMYMVICITDFLVFPILWSIVQALSGTGQVKDQWEPLTLQGAGLFHIAMGVVLGLTTWGRTQEKINGASMYPSSQSMRTTTYYNTEPTPAVTKPVNKPKIAPVQKPNIEPDD